jgi:hypothetical protein
MSHVTQPDSAGGLVEGRATEHTTEFRRVDFGAMASGASMSSPATPRSGHGAAAAAPAGSSRWQLALRALTLGALLGSGLAAPAIADNSDRGAMTAPFSLLDGLRGAQIGRIAVDPHESTRIYADAGGGRIARTSNGGLRWELVPLASTSEYFRALAVDPADSAVVLAFSSSDADGCASGGVYTSRDFGVHWRRLANQPVGERGTAGCGRGLVIDPAGSTIVLGDRRQGIFRSADFGRTWTNPLPASRAQVFSLDTDPNDAATLWAAGKDRANRLVATAWVSHDFGSTWSTVPIPDLDPALAWTPTALAVQPQSGKVLIGVSAFDPATYEIDARILASADGGRTWTNSSRGLGGPDELGAGIGNSIVFDPRSPAIVYASTNGGLASFRSLDSGATWNAVTPQETNGFFTLAVAPGFGGGFAGGTRVLGGGTSFFSSVDHGTTWTRQDAGLDAVAARFVTDDGEHAGGIYAISSVNGLVHSRSAGEHWTAIDPQPDIRATVAVAVDSVAPTHPVYVVTRNAQTIRFWRGTALGQHWTPLDIPASANVASLIADPLQAGHVYATYGAYAPLTGGLRSVDFGAHWTPFTVGVDGDYPALANPLVADPGHPGTFYMALGSGLWKSGDSGASWSPLASLPLGVYGIAGLAVTGGPSTAVYVVAGADDGTFSLQKSTDGGMTWGTASTGAFGDAPFGLAAGPGGRLFGYSSNYFRACDQPQIQLSTDGAASWSEVAAGNMFSTFQFRSCPTVVTTASQLYVGDPYGSFLTYGAGYRDLQRGLSSPAPRARALAGRSSTMASAPASAALRQEAIARAHRARQAIPVQSD